MRIVALFLLSGWLIASASAATLTNADAVFNYATAKNGTYDSFSADFAQSMNMLGRAAKMAGVMSYKKPGQLRMELAMPMMEQEQRVVAVIGPDQILWQQVSIGSLTNVIKMDFQHVPSNNPAAAMMKNPFENIDPQRRLAQARERYTFELLPDGELHGQAMYVLQGRLKADAKLAPPEMAILGGLGKQKISIGQQDGFMHRIEQYDAGDSNVVMQIDFTNLKLNIPLSDALFVYKPAPNANVVDMTQMILQMMSQPQKKTPAGK